MLYVRVFVRLRDQDLLPRAKFTKPVSLCSKCTSFLAKRSRRLPSVKKISSALQESGPQALPKALRAADFR